MSFPKANIKVKRRGVVRSRQIIASQILRPRKSPRRRAPKDLPSLLSELKWAAEIFARVMEKDGNQDSADFCRELIRNTDACLANIDIEKLSNLF